MYGLSARVKSGLDYFIKIKVTVLRRAVANQNSLIGVFHMKGILVSLCINGYRSYAHFL